MSTAALPRRSRETTRLLPRKLSPLLRLTRATALRCSALWVLLFSLYRERSLHFRSSLLALDSLFPRSKHSIACSAWRYLVGRLLPSSSSSSPWRFPSTAAADFGPFPFLSYLPWATSWTEHAREAGGAKRASDKRPSLVFLIFGNLTTLYDSLYISSCTKSIHTRHFTLLPRSYSSVSVLSSLSVLS